MPQPPYRDQGRTFQIHTSKPGLEEECSSYLKKEVLMTKILLAKVQRQAKETNSTVQIYLTLSRICDNHSFKPHFTQ
jgi:hypothetical protein